MYSMKGLNISKAVLSVALALSVFSCKKDDKEGTPTTITPAEMADAVSQAFTTESAGFVAQTKVAFSIMTAANKAEGRLADLCKQSFDTTLTGKNADTAKVFAYGYNMKWNWAVSCSDAGPDQILFKYRGGTTYQGPRMTAEDTASATITLSGLQDTVQFYTMNQTYERSGYQQLLTGSKKAIKSTIKIISSNMKINKTTGLIVSGTATIKIEGSTNSSADLFSRSGSFTFSGNESGSLVMDDVKYTVAWVNE